MGEAKNPKPAKQEDREDNQPLDIAIKNKPFAQAAQSHQARRQP
jgi:hypothetical protein